jgi:hypothetical protein
MLAQLARPLSQPGIGRDWRSVPPVFLASLTSPLPRPMHQLGARRMPTALGCTVVSTTRRVKEGLAAPARAATATLSRRSAISFSSPMRFRQRVSDEVSNGALCWKNSSPQNSWKYGFSAQRAELLIGEAAIRWGRQRRMAGLVRTDSPEPILETASRSLWRASPAHGPCRRSHRAEPATNNSPPFSRRSFGCIESTPPPLTRRRNHGPQRRAICKIIEDRRAKSGKREHCTVPAYPR